MKMGENTILGVTTKILSKSQALEYSSHQLVKLQKI